ncbi:MAG: hypothetical protein ACE367_11260 [Acidimicrobiales bacterium]
MHFSEHEPADPASIAIDCATCVMRCTDACDDCLVTFICDREPDEAVVITLDELRSMRLLSDAGLVPQLQHRSRPA